MRLIWWVQTRPVSFSVVTCCAWISPPALWWDLATGDLADNLVTARCLIDENQNLSITVSLRECLDWRVELAEDNFSSWLIWRLWLHIIFKCEVCYPRDSPCGKLVKKMGVRKTIGFQLDFTKVVRRRIFLLSKSAPNYILLHTNKFS